MTEIISISGSKEIFDQANLTAKRKGLKLSQYIVSLISKDQSGIKITELMDETFPKPQSLQTTEPLTSLIPSPSKEKLIEIAKEELSKTERTEHGRISELKKHIAELEMQD